MKREASEGSRTTGMDPKGIMLITGLVMGLLVILAGKLSWIQVKGAIAGKPNRHVGARQWQIEKPRGDILDAKGRLLATSLFVFDVELNCRANRDFPEELAFVLQDILAPVLDRKALVRIKGLFRIATKPRTDLKKRAADEGATADEIAKFGKQKKRYVWTTPVFAGLRDGALLERLKELGRKPVYEIVAGRRATELSAQERAVLQRDFSFTLEFKARWKRYYPLGRAACHVIGIAGAGGASGLEASPVLASEGTLSLPVNLGTRYMYMSKGVAKKGGAKSSRRTMGYYAGGKTALPLPHELVRAKIVTSLDSDCQETAWRLLCDAAAKVREHYGAKVRAHTVDKIDIDWGVLLMLDLTSGELLALTGLPDFDPNHPKKGDTFVSVIHENLFVPGSVIKPLLLATALERGDVRPGQKIRCESDEGGKIWRFGPRTITDDHHIGTVTIEELLVRSSNIGATRVGLIGGPELHRDMIERFSLGHAPRLGLPLPRALNKASGRREIIEGVLPSPESLERGTREFRLYRYWVGPSLSFGYSMNIYPLNFANAFASLATGREFSIRLLRSVAEPLRPPIEIAAAGPGRRILSDATIDWLRSTLTRVISDEKGTGWRIAGPEVNGVLAGKTGTSIWHPNPKNKITRKRGNTASFIAFAPADRPRYLAMAVLARTGGRAFYGGQFAAPPVKELLLYMLHRDERRLRAAADQRYCQGAQRFRQGRSAVSPRAQRAVVDDRAGRRRRKAVYEHDRGATGASGARAGAGQP